jgi:zeaxanthin glucosyltransferase
MKIGFVSLPLSGHLNPMTALARKLQSRGHEVVFFGVPDVGPFARAANLDFVSYGEKEYPIGSIAESWGEVAKMRGLSVLEYTSKNLTPALVKVALEHLPEKIAESGVDALVLDSIYRFVELIPIHMGIPYAQVWVVLQFDVSGSTPPGIFSWLPDPSPEARAKNIEGLKMFGSLRTASLLIGQSFAAKNGLDIDWNNPGATTSKLAVITQTPKEFDFPGIPWPPQFHYAGPLHDSEGREPVPFPWEKLTGKPLIYASLGTLLNGLENVYAAILQAVKTLPDMQVVISVGKSANLEALGTIPPNAIVVRSAPQIELLKRAALCITHAGLNTTLEALAQGVPMVAIPVGFEQPGIAARIAYHGAGEFVELEDVSTERLSALIQQVHGDPGYRDKARYFQKVIERTHGLDIAADVIEQAFKANLVKEHAALSI